MKKSLLTLLIIISTTNLIAQTNIVPNGNMENWDSFDTNPDEWFRFINGFWEKNSDAQNGTASLQLEIDNGRTFIYINTPDMQFTSGVTYVCTFYYKAVSGTFTKTKYKLSHTPGAFPEEIVAHEFIDFSTSIWTKGEFEFTASTTENVQAFIYAYGTEGSKILIDNVSIIDKSTLLVNNFKNDLNNINTYPNPSCDYIKISGLKKIETYTIYNTLGKIVLVGTVKKNEKIDIRSLSNGIYLLKTKKGKTLKIIKQ